ncbi:MAG: hypothetical protein AB8B96_21945 [Lysobacterales bacterium]
MNTDSRRDAVTQITETPLPAAALLQRYAGQWEGGAVVPYTDSFSVCVDGEISLSEFVGAFYTTWLFRIERWILAIVLRQQSTDQQARLLGDGTIKEFAAWRVELRTDTQLLLCDLESRTRSWLMVEADENRSSAQPMTRLWFGSAVVPAPNRKTGQMELGRVFKWLLGFHRWYSKALLAASVKNL